jgi:multiple sugar transport system substrate-binding protein
MRHTTTRILALAAAAALSLTACGGGDAGGGSAAGSTDAAGKVTLNFTWWGNDDRAKRYKESLALFEKKFPNIKVNANFQDFPSYWTARSTEAAGRSLPDVLQMDLSYIREYSENGHLLDLNEYMGKEINVPDYEESFLASGKHEDQQVGIPTSTNTLSLVVNPALVKQAGVEMLPEDYTWEQFNEWTTKITKAGLKTKGQAVYGTGDYTGTTWFFIQWLLQQGKQPFSDDGKFNFTKDDVKAYLNLTSDLRAQKLLIPASRTTQLKPKDAFAAKEQATSFTWDNFLAGYATDTGQKDLQVLPVPTGDNGKKGMFWKPSMLLSAGANTEHPKEAAQLINFLVTEPEVGKIFGTSKGVPASKAQREAMNLEPGSTDAVVTDFEAKVTDQVTEKTPVPIRGFGAIEAEWLRLSEDLNYGKITVDQFVDQWWTEAESATK